tara:strand:+ start:193 stop:429 length:237 start_codon:yes stop_codon:yes gene_type:complete
MYNADPDYTLGAELITDTAAHTGRFKSIFFYENTQVNTASSNLTGNSINSETFPAGSTIYGLFTSITLSSGACLAYKI